jgi:enoyl-CoA hydratase/carnithine racemase
MGYLRLLAALISIPDQKEKSMERIQYALDDQIAVVTLNDGENRFNPPFLEEFLDVLDAVEAQEAAHGLVVTSAHEKIFSNGIDLEWVLSVARQQEMAVIAQFFEQLNALFKRILLYPMPTVAALSGHVFAGGAILSCAFDVRFMRSDRGYFCFPEIDLGTPFMPGMLALIQKAIPPHVFEELQLTGRRLTAQECKDLHFIRAACPHDELLSKAVSWAKGVQKRRVVVAEMKQRLHGRIVEIMEREDPAVVRFGKLRF